MPEVEIDEAVSQVAQNALYFEVVGDSIEDFFDDFFEYEHAVVRHDGVVAFEVSEDLVEEML